MSGLAATEYIMAHCPTPILIVSASTNRGELFKTYDALAAGAVDVLEKPRGDEPTATGSSALRRGREAGRADRGHHPPARAPGAWRAARSPPAAPSPRRRRARRHRGWSRSARPPAGPARSSSPAAPAGAASACRSCVVLHIGRAVRRRRSPTGSTADRPHASRSRADGEPLDALGRAGGDGAAGPAPGRARGRGCASRDDARAPLVPAVGRRALRVARRRVRRAARVACLLTGHGPRRRRRACWRCARPAG